MITSEVEPHDSIGEDSCVCQPRPSFRVRPVAIERDFPRGGFLVGSEHSRVHLTLLLVEVDLLEHELAGFFSVVELADQRKLIQAHVIEDVDCWAVGDGVLVLWLSTVQDALHGLIVRA